jgi:hypothetical protein
MTTKIVGFVIKVMKQKLEVNDTFLQCYDIFTSFIFIELSIP